jgi:hypothetical protein
VLLHWDGRQLRCAERPSLPVALESLDAIACYPRDAIVDAISIFAAKRERGTLPEGVDGRYLLGIARNLDHVHEADAITQALLRERLAARDRFLEPLVRDRDSILRDAAVVPATLDALLDHLLAAEREIDRHFWLDAIAMALVSHDEGARRELAHRAARRVHAAFRLDARERHRLVHLLLRRLWPLA